MAVHARQQKNEPGFFWQRFHGLLESPAELIGRRNIFRGRSRCVDRPKCFPLLTTSRRTRLIQSEPEGDSNQPSPKSRRIAKPRKTPVSTEQGLLGNVLGVGGVAQDSTRDPEGQSAALFKALLEFPPEGCLLQIERQ